MPAPSPFSGATAAAGAAVFTSPHYGYTLALPAGWSARGAQRWGGPGSRGLGKDGIDVFHGPPYVVAWAFAAPTPPSLAGYVTAVNRAAAQSLPCPAAPQVTQQLTIGGTAAWLIGLSCPSRGGIFLLTAATTHEQAAIVFVFQDSSGIKAAQQADLMAFRELLAGLRFR